MSNKEHKIEYRVVRQSKDGDEWLSMQEVYFDGEDKAYAHTVDLDVTGDSLSEIRKKLQSMLWAIDKDIVDEIQNDVMEDDMDATIEEKEKTYIYESPDGGDTIYRRVFGETKREKLNDNSR